MFKLLKRMHKREFALSLLIIVFVIIQVFFDLQIPQAMSDLTAVLQQSNNTTLSAIKTPSILMIVYTLGSCIASVVVGYLSAVVSASLSAGIRGDLFSKVQHFSLKELNKFSTASLITRTTNDITQIQNLVAMSLQVMIKAPVMAIWSISKIAHKNSTWTFSTSIAVIILIILIVSVLALTSPRFRIIQSLTDKLNNIVRENLTGLRVVRAYNAEEYQTEKFNEISDNLTNTHIFVGRIMSLLQPSTNFILNILTLSVYWIGTFLISKNGNVEIRINIFSDMVVFSSYAVQIIAAFMMLTFTLILLPRARVSALRVNEVLDTELSIVDGNLDSSVNESGTVEFKNVTFRYQDSAEPVLKNINFKANKGDTVAIIGSTGSGKSTIINLISRLYDVQQGEVLVNGLNVKDYSLENLNNKVSYISQKPILFSGTIKSNIEFGNNDNLTDDDIYNALEIAQAIDFVKETEDKLDTKIAEGGTNFSGGQKQRISIARAIARKPEIMLFDDSFSALDYKTDKKLRKELDNRLSDTTRIIVAQRVSTIIDADLILVINEGEIVGRGTHKELLKSNSVYREIAYSQLSKEELENE